MEAVVQRDEKFVEAWRVLSDDYARRQTFNTAIAAVMELLNEIGLLPTGASVAGRAAEREAMEAAVLLLAPVAPHICHVLWHELGHAGAVIDAPWPQADQAAMVGGCPHRTAGVGAEREIAQPRRHRGRRS